MFKACYNQILDSIAQNSIIGICGGVTYQLVGLEASYPFVAVYVMVVIDMIFGTWLAKKEKRFSWSTWGNKFAQKVFTWSLLTVTAHQLTIVEPMLKAFEGYVFVIMVAADAGSAFKNARKINSSVPSALPKLAKKIKDKADNIMTKL